MKKQVKSKGSILIITGLLLFISCKKDYINIDNENIYSTKTNQLRASAFIPDLKITVFTQNGTTTQDSTYYKIPVKIYERNVGTDSAKAPDSILVYQRRYLPGGGIIDLRVPPVFHRLVKLAPASNFIITGQVWVKKEQVNKALGLYLVAKADGPNSIAESNEGNNYSSVMTVVFP